MRIIVKMKFGAHLYGTATPDSDVDYKGIFLPTKEELLLGRVPKSYNYSTGREESSKKMREVWNQLPRVEHCYDVAPDPNGMRQYQVCGKSFQESATIGYVIPIVEKFYNDYGRRAKLAAENKNIDWKAVSHALRAAYQTKEILTENTINFPLRNADFLVIVKQGKLDYLSEGGPVLETLMEEVESLALTSNLPETVERGFWNQFICDTLERELF